MKKVDIFCDLCRNQINYENLHVQQMLKESYVNKDICPYCDITIGIAAVIERYTTLTGKSSKQVLAEWLEVYHRKSASRHEEREIKARIEEIKNSYDN